MAKRNRGKALKRFSGGGRGECPLCHRTGVKLLYEYRGDPSTVLNVCKNCKGK